jgi:pimeloyl-ACP methyl ester carboxylesterase
LRVALLLVIVLLLGYSGVSAYIATHITAQRHVSLGTPADVGLAYESIAFESAVDHIPLKGWYLPASGSRAIVLVHGIDGNRWEQQGQWSELLVPALVHGGFDVLTFDLRAHGESGGEHVGLGSLERRDVAAAVALIRERGVHAGGIGLFGQSFGAATALNAAAIIPDVGGVVSDSAFADARPLLDQEIHRYTGLPAIFTPGITVACSAFYGIDLTATPEKAMLKIAPRPALLIHGTADTRIPVENAYRLKAASNSSAVDLWIVPGAEHTQAYLVDPDFYARTIVGFFERALVSPPPAHSG